MCYGNDPFEILSIGAVVLLFVSSGVTMAVPFCMGKIIDIIYTESETHNVMMHKLTAFSKMLCGVFLMGALANAVRVYLIYTSGLYFVKNSFHISTATAMLQLQGQGSRTRQAAYMHPEIMLTLSFCRRKNHF